MYFGSQFRLISMPIKPVSLLSLLGFELIGIKINFSLLRYSNTVNTIRSFRCQECVQTDVLSRNHKTKSAARLRLLTQTIEAPKKRNRTLRMTKQKEYLKKEDS